MSKISLLYNVSLSTIRHINYGESWRDKQANYPLRKQDGREKIFNEDELE